MTPSFARLQDAVRTNCHISDAQHGRELTLCTYLLEMREMYRWERGIAFGAPLPQADVGTWMAQREELWSSLEQSAHVPVPVAGLVVDPFDVERANRAVSDTGSFTAPASVASASRSFSWARSTARSGAMVYGFSSRPRIRARPVGCTGRSRDGTIFVRLESLRRGSGSAPRRGWAGAGRRAKSALAGYGFAEAPDAAIARWRPPRPRR